MKIAFSNLYLTKRFYVWDFSKNNAPSLYDYNFDTSRNISRLIGKSAKIKIPKCFRRLLFGRFAKAYKIKLDEMEADITSYTTFLEFFTRKIKPRPIDADPLSVVSPADCKVLAFSEVTSDEVVIVKGVSYSLGELLTGIPDYPLTKETLENMKQDKNNKLFHCILYLAPGDYHRFHSPAKMSVKLRNYIFGTLLPVKREYALTGKMKYDKNERVTVFGDWLGGIMNLVFVGALNVGSIELNFDPELKTNVVATKPFNPTVVKSFTKKGGAPAKFENLESIKTISGGVKVEKGAEIGRFNLGSSIVMFFEAHKDFKFTIQDGQTLRYGEVIGK